ncbi:MAG: tetratricopeptide repeat protein [Nitrospinae bacterium]|nr:tetratricopeptide repeat protein [Nitrospinota bacterium]MDA1110101.1 tetratricopeptide repeat protein [Nitrospinota bacterium]
MSEREIQNIPEWISQVILFLFGGWLFKLGSDLISANQPWLTVSIFGLGVLLIGMAGVGPTRIANFGAKWGKGGGEFGVSVRNQPTEKERELVLKVSQDQLSPEIEKEEQDYIKEAEERAPERRSPEDYLALATEKWRAKDYDGALADVFAGLALNPKNIRIKASLIHRKGSAFHDLGLMDQAKKYYKEAIELDPSFSLPHSNLGYLYQGQGNLEAAKKEYKEAIELDPSFSLPHHNLGNLYKGQGNLEAAKKEYEEALRLDPELTLARKYLEKLKKEMEKGE